MVAVFLKGICKKKSSNKYWSPQF